MIANPLHASTALLAGKDVEANLGPVVDSLGDLDGLVLGMIGGVNSVDELPLSIGCEVGVQFNHDAVRRHGVGAINLDFIIALCVSRLGKKNDDSGRNKSPREVLQMCSFVLMTNDAGSRTQEKSRVAKQCHESGIHVILLMAVEQGVSGVVGNQVSLNRRSRLYDNNVFENAARSLASNRHQFEGVTVEMHRDDRRCFDSRRPDGDATPL